MSAQDCCSGRRALVPAATAPLLGDASGSSGSSSQPAGTTRCRPRMPKRTSFPCMACGRTFPTQQAMAGHCSAHNRTRLAGHQLLPAGGQAVQGFGHHGLPAGVQGSSSATNRAPALVLPYPSFLPFIHPMMSSQVIRGPSCLEMHGPSPTMEIWPVLHQIQAPPPVPAAHLFQGPVFQSYTLMPMPCHATMGAVPRLRSSAYSANQPRGVRPDLALQLGSGGGNSAQKRTLLPLLEEDGRRSKRAAVVLDGGDGGGQEGEDMDDLDLELRL
ncbi:unnamed protein product [Urochloa decumbens]|uniref:C2H2-type domain-containing protein n=1 Tax=Urochloa decumbens TaxID=240449 RepID=A0ABC9E8M7_9POAL